MLAQTLVEYGLLNSIAAGFAAARNRVEMFIGSGNSKFLVLAVFAVLLAFLMKRRRVT